MDHLAPVLIKICDFGVARIVGDQMTGAQGTLLLGVRSCFPIAYTSLGTALWMAPEVLNNLPYTVKADVWSLGVIMGEIATRELPFANLGFLDAMNALSQGKLSSPILPPETPMEYCDVRERCLERVIDERATAMDVVDALVGAVMRDHMSLEANSSGGKIERTRSSEVQAILKQFE
jgi:serine/threonine protein kinase